MVATRYHDYDSGPPRRPQPAKRKPENRIVRQNRSRTWLSVRHDIPIGLRNPGNLCYRRALQQCLTHVPVMHTHLGNVHQKKCSRPIRQCVVCAMQHLSALYWDEEQRTRLLATDITILDDAVNYRGPGTVRAYPHLQTNNQNDPGEYFDFLHANLENAEHHSSKRLNRLFTHSLDWSWQCSHCSDVIYSNNDQRESAPKISLALDDNTLSTLDELLDHFFNHGQLMKTCPNTCATRGDPNGPHESNIRMTISQAPAVLVIHIERTTLRTTKIRRHVDYPVDLDLSTYTTGNSALDYRLYGVIGHEGRHAEVGHYIASVRTKGGPHPFAWLSDAAPVRYHDDDRALRRLNRVPGMEANPMCLVYVKV